MINQIDFDVREDPREIVFNVSAPPRAEIGVSDNQIVPEDYQNLLMYYRDQMTEAYFGIGDIASALSDRAASTGFAITEQRVFEAVGRFCGKSGRTVRYYAETSRFYPEDIRRKYEMLPFTHFVFAKSLGDDWMAVLDFSSLNPGSTVDSLRNKFLQLPSDVSESPRVDVSELPRDDVSALLRASDEEIEKIFEAPPLSADDKQYAAEIADKTRSYAAITKLSDFVSGLNAIERLINALPDGIIDKDTILADITRVRGHIAKIAVAIMPNKRPS